MSAARDKTAKTSGRPAPAEPDLPRFSSSRCKSCGICLAFCPKNALQEGPEGVPEVGEPEACNACRLCRDLCPDFAVEFPEG